MAEIRTAPVDSKSIWQREVVGTFYSSEELEGAISDLQSAGWDRAEMSLLGQSHLFSPEVPPQGENTQVAGDLPATPRGAVVSDTDVRQGRILASSLAATLAAFAAAGATILTGGGALAAMVGAAVAGGGAGVVTNAVGRMAGESRVDFLHEQVRHGGILLWVALRTPDQEQTARDILTKHGAQNVHVHESPSQ